MPSEFERAAIRRLIAKAHEVGVEVPQRVSSLACGQVGSGGAVLWNRAHPGDEGELAGGCCWGAAMRGPADCTCWVPVFATEQAPAVLPVGPADVVAREAMCGDCAFRKGSPERADAYTEETLLELPGAGTPFWCHEDMRRPVLWRHPDGRAVAGSTDDWQPGRGPGGLPLRADGRVALLCAGWAARVARVPDTTA